jgi:hypothetical protein
MLRSFLFGVSGVDPLALTLAAVIAAAYFGRVITVGPPRCNRRSHANVTGRVVPTGSQPQVGTLGVSSPIPAGLAVFHHPLLLAFPARNARPKNIWQSNFCVSC